MANSFRVCYGAIFGFRGTSNSEREGNETEMKKRALLFA